jgi:nucleotide-binding universal stress UspA family protein
MHTGILVPLDGSELSECVLPHLTFLARACEDREAILIRVLLSPEFLPQATDYLNPSFLAKLETANREAAERYLTQAANRLIAEGIRTRWTTVKGVTAADSIADYAAKNNVGLILMASHGRSGVSRWVWSDTAERVLRTSCVPVMMVRAPGCGPRVFNVSFEEE